MAPKHESTFGLQEPIRHFWSAERHSKSAELPSYGLWPNSLRVTIRHTLFNLFTKGCVRIQTIIVRTYFLESSGLYKQRLNLLIHHFFFYTLRSIHFLLSNHTYFLIISLSVAAKLGFLGFKKIIEQNSLNPKTSSQEKSVLM